MTPLRWGLIGAGDISRKRIAPALRDLSNCDFVSVSRANSALAEAFAVEFGASKWFPDWRSLVSDDQIDAVYIATPVYLHAEQTIAAAEAGKHVLCEKPMALNPRDCDEMIAACRANNVKLGVAYYRRFYPVVQRIRTLIASGALGKVSLVQINAFEYFDPPEDHPRRWLIDRKLSGGGPLIDFGCHRIELLRYLFGDPTRVSGCVSNGIFNREVEDTALVSLGFEGGTNASVAISHAVREAQDSLNIYGSEGSVHIENLNRGTMRLKIGDRETVEELPPHPNFHLPLIDEFTESVLNNREPAVDGSTGKIVSEISDEVYGF